MMIKHLVMILLHFAAVPVIISVFPLLPYERSCMCDEVINTEELILNAVKTEYDWTRRHRLRAGLAEIQYFKKSKIYEVRVSMDHSPTYLVAADVTGNTEVFSPYPDIVNPSDVIRFSKVIKKEDIKLTENNIKSYISSFLFLADFHSVSIDDIDDIEQHFPYIKMFIKNGTEYRKAVGPPKYEFEEKKIVIKFCSWKNSGCLRKWNLEILPDGEILSWNAENIAVFHF